MRRRRKGEMSGNPLLSLLETDALSASDIARSLGKPVSDIGAELSMLTLMGQLVERGGKYFLHHVDKN